MNFASKYLFLKHRMSFVLISNIAALSVYLTCTVVLANKVISIEGGDSHFCAIFETKKMKCWGSNMNRQLGSTSSSTSADGTKDGASSLLDVNLGSDFILEAVKLGKFHTCALSELGSVKCFGDGAHGQLGQGSLLSIGYPTEMGDSLPYINCGNNGLVSQLALGDGHTCLLFTTGKVACFGNNAKGQLGVENMINLGGQASDMGNNLKLINFGLGMIVQSIHSNPSASHNCAVFIDRTVRCWGDNTYNQLGYQDKLNIGGNINDMGSNLPAINLGNTEGRAPVISVGTYCTCALIRQEVKCWGSNYDGELGLGSQIYVGFLSSHMGDNLPVMQLGTNIYASKVSPGTAFNCVLLVDGNVKCFGNNFAGQLGQGDTNNRGQNLETIGDKLPSIKFHSSVKVLDISCGGVTCCILTKSNEIKCWGSNALGQLGVGDQLNKGDSAGEMENLQSIDFFSLSSRDKLLIGIFTPMAFLCLLVCITRTHKILVPTAVVIKNHGNLDLDNVPVAIAAPVEEVQSQTKNDSNPITNGKTILP